MHKSLLPLALLSLIAIPVAHADDATKRTKITELLTLLKVDQIPQEIISGAKQQTETLGHREFGATETAEQQKQVAELHEKVVTVLHGAVDWKVMQPDFITLYSNAYTEPQLDGILAFYKSPAGQAYLSKNPELQQKYGEIVHQHMAPVQPQLRDLVQNFSKANAPAAASPAGAPHSSTAPAKTTPPSN